MWAAVAAAFVKLGQPHSCFRAFGAGDGENVRPRDIYWILLRASSEFSPRHLHFANPRYQLMLRRLFGSAGIT
jgi:hypothetical protein